MKPKRISKRHYEITLLVWLLLSMLIPILGIFDIGDWGNPLIIVLMSISLGIHIARLIYVFFKVEEDDLQAVDTSNLEIKLKDDEIELLEDFVDKLVEKRNMK